MGRGRNVPGVDRQLDDTHFDQQRARSLTQRCRESVVEETRTVEDLTQPVKRIPEGGQWVTAEHVITVLRLASDQGREPEIPGDHMVDQRAHIPFRARRRMLKLIRPDTGDDIGSHAPRPAVNIPRIRH